MAYTIEDTYENGVLKLKEPLPLMDYEQVRITNHPPVRNLADCYGIMGFTGTTEEADYVVKDPELDYPLPRERP
jgi:predicted DNA-binding antitoxin AbrB/MazE fold protein